MSLGSLALLITLVLTACDSEPVAPPSVVFPENNVSFNGHVKPVLLNNCAISGCHDGFSSDPDNPGTTIFRLESYIDVMSSGIISTIEPDRSRLAQVLRGQLLHVSDRYFNALNDNQREGIVKWIHEGALNN